MVILIPPLTEKTKPETKQDSAQQLKKQLFLRALSITARIWENKVLSYYPSYSGRRCQYLFSPANIPRVALKHSRTLPSGGSPNQAALLQDLEGLPKFPFCLPSFTEVSQLPPRFCQDSQSWNCRNGLYKEAVDECLGTEDGYRSAEQGRISLLRLVNRSPPYTQRQRWPLQEPQLLQHA